MEVRRLQPGELARFRAALSVFERVFEDPDHYGTQPDDAYIEARLRDPLFSMLVSVEDGAVIGALAGYELVKFEKPRSEFYVYDLAVEAHARRRGVATALIEAFRARAAERGGWLVFVQADLGDDPAIALYTKLGRREDVLHFDIDV